MSEAGKISNGSISKHIDMEKSNTDTNEKHKLIHILFDEALEKTTCQQNSGEINIAFPQTQPSTKLSIVFENFPDAVYVKNNGRGIEIVSGIEESNPTALKCGTHLNNGIRVIYRLEKTFCSSKTNCKKSKEVKGSQKQYTQEKHIYRNLQGNSLDGQTQLIVEDVKQPKKKLYFKDVFQNTDSFYWKDQYKGSLQFLLVGCCGNGRSATGNTILRRQCFETSSNMSGKFSQPVINSVDRGNFDITVIDGPGFDSESSTEDIVRFAGVLEKCLELSKYSISGIVVVMKYGSRLTNQHTMLIHVIKLLFGKDIFLSHGICVFTHGDIFREDMNDDRNSHSFDDWCRRQKGETQKLFEEFGQRVMIFDNSTNDSALLETQLNQLILLAKPLQPFSKCDFDSCVEERNAFIAQLRLKDQVSQSEQNVNLIRENYHYIKDEPLLLKEDRIAHLKTFINQIEQIEPISPKLKSEIEVLKNEMCSRMKCIEHDLYNYGESC